ASFTACFAIWWFLASGLGSGPSRKCRRFLIAARDLRHGGLARDRLGPIVHERLPEIRPAHGEADEALHSGGRRQPFVNFPVVLPSAQDAAADLATATAARGRRGSR